MVIQVRAYLAMANAIRSSLRCRFVETLHDYCLAQSSCEISF